VALLTGDPPMVSRATGVVRLTIASVIVVWYIVIGLFLKGFVMAKKRRVSMHAGPEPHRPNPELSRWALGPGTVSKSRKGGKRHVAPRPRLSIGSFARGAQAKRRYR
jgi:hypothetical protein